MKRLNDLGLRINMLFAPGLVLVMMLIMACILYAGIQDSQARERLVTHSYQVMGGTDDLNLQLVNMETGYRGFLLTGDEAFLAPYNSGWEAYQRLQQELRDLVRDEPQRVDQLEDLDQDVRSWQNTILKPGITLRRAVTDGTMQFGVITAFESSNSGKYYSDHVRAQIETFRMIDISQLERRRQESQSSATRLQMMLIGGSVLALLLGLLVSTRIAGRITRRVGLLVHATTAITAGGLGQHNELPEGRDEVGTLAESFVTMAATIQKQLQDLKAQSEAAEMARAAAEAARAATVAQLNTIEEQRSTIRAMSVPILPINAQTMVMPLVGVLDNERMELLQERAFHTIEQSSVRHLILDITGVSMVDSHVVHGLIRVIQGARLLGTEVVLVGIRPEVAEALIGLGIDLDDIVARHTLQTGIAYTRG